MLSVALSDDFDVVVGDDGVGMTVPPAWLWPGALVVVVAWWSSRVTAGYSLFSVIADCAAVRSTMDFSAA